MQPKDLEQIVEASWRRPLTAIEQAQLEEHFRAHPEARAEWGREAALSRLIERLPAASVSSNFTARVLEAARRTPVESAWTFRFRVWWPRVAAGALAAGVCLISVREHQASHRLAVERQLVEANRVGAMPQVEWLNNFDTIQHLDRVKLADDELLAALQ